MQKGLLLSLGVLVAMVMVDGLQVGSIQTGIRRKHLLRIEATVDEVAETLADRLVATARDGENLGEFVKTEFDKISEEVIADLSRLSKEGESAAEEAMAAVRDESEFRMNAAKDRLITILDAGELLEMDRRLSKLFRDGEADTAFLVVLNMNAVAAAQAAQNNPKDDAALQRSRVMEHLYTRAQEEWETRFVPMAEGVLHRLARTEQEVIRRNILEHYLAPKTHIDMPNGKDPVPLDKPQPPLLPAADFAQAIDLAVTRLRNLSESPQPDGASLDPAIIEASIESLRDIAKEARLLLIDRGTPEDVKQFQDDLSRTWPSAPSAD